jgi:hypothetical protein
LTPIRPLFGIRTSLRDSSRSHNEPPSASPTIWIGKGCQHPTTVLVLGITRAIHPVVEVPRPSSKDTDDRGSLNGGAVKFDRPVVIVFHNGANFLPRAPCTSPREPEPRKIRKVNVEISDPYVNWWLDLSLPSRPLFHGQFHDQLVASHMRLPRPVSRF